MNLKELFKFLDHTLEEEIREDIKNCEDFIPYHHTFGRWLRNNTGMWAEDGTKELVSDIYAIPDSEYRNEALIEHNNEAKKEPLDSIIDFNLDHPDNCSHIVLNMYRDHLLGKLILK